MLSDWELLVPSPSEPDFTRFSFSVGCGSGVEKEKKKRAVSDNKQVLIQKVVLFQCKKRLFTQLKKKV